MFSYGVNLLRNGCSTCKSQSKQSTLAAHIHVIALMPFSMLPHLFAREFRFREEEAKERKAQGSCTAAVRRASLTIPKLTPNQGSYNSDHRGLQFNISTLSC
jgi:hypothetical protein